MEKNTKKKKEDKECCDKDCGCHDEDPSYGEEHSHVDSSNPFANLDKDTQMKIQELQMLEQSFQHFMQQKNAFSMELSETKYILEEVKKYRGEFSRIVGGQVIISSSKEDILKEFEKKKGLIENRMKEIDKQEKEFSKKMVDLREEVLKNIRK